MVCVPCRGAPVCWSTTHNRRLEKCHVSAGVARECATLSSRCSRSPRCAAVRPAASERKCLHACFAVPVADISGPAWLACGIVTGPFRIAHHGSPARCRVTECLLLADVAGRIPCAFGSRVYAQLRGVITFAARDMPATKSKCSKGGVLRQGRCATSWATRRQNNAAPATQCHPAAQAQPARPSHRRPRRQLLRRQRCRPCLWQPCCRLHHRHPRLHQTPRPSSRCCLRTVQAADDDAPCTDADEAHATPM